MAAMCFALSLSSSECNQEQESTDDWTAGSKHKFQFATDEEYETIDQIIPLQAT